MAGHHSIGSACSTSSSISSSSPTLVNLYHSRERVELTGPTSGRLGCQHPGAARGQRSSAVIVDFRHPSKSDTGRRAAQVAPRFLQDPRVVNRSVPGSAGTLDRRACPLCTVPRGAAAVCALPEASGRPGAAAESTDGDYSMLPGDRSAGRNETRSTPVRAQSHRCKNNPLGPTAAERSNQQAVGLVSSTDVLLEFLAGRLSSI